MKKDPIRRYLNFNAPAGKILAAVAILIAGAPLLLYLIGRLLGIIGMPWPGAAQLIKGSVFLGLALLAVFMLLIVVEQIQDAVLFHLYRRNRRKRIQYSAEFAECPYCGNRRVRSFDRACPVCGKSLQPEDKP